MPNEPHTPFDDVDLPPRTDQQERDDHVRNEEQKQLLAADDSQGTQQAGPGSGDALLDVLMARRADAPEGIVRFEPVDPVDDDSERRSLVVPRQLLVRLPGVGDPPRAEVDEVLVNNHFTEDQGLRDSVLCPDLAERLTVYTHQGEDALRVDDMRKALGELPPGDDREAAPTLVTALHKTIVKAASGPAPTTPDPAVDAFRRAGRHTPGMTPTVAVIDTGIRKETREDGWLNEVPRNGGNIDPLDVFPSPSPLPPPQVGNLKLDFAAGHGTFAAGIVRLVDPDARILVYAALDSDGLGSENDIACAMIQAVRDGADVLNLSLGMHTVDNEPSLAFEIALEVIEEIVRDDPERDLPVIVASAGNYGDEVPVWPAALAASSGMVIAVAGLTPELQPADWSSFGDWVTFSCVGEGIVSTFVPGDEDPQFSATRPGSPAPDHYPLNDVGDPWAVWTGTSFAAPQIAGAISRTMREEGKSPHGAVQHLLNQGADIPGYGKALMLLRGTP